MKIGIVASGFVGATAGYALGDSKVLTLSLVTVGAMPLESFV